MLVVLINCTTYVGEFLHQFSVLLQSDVIAFDCREPPIDACHVMVQTDDDPDEQTQRAEERCREPTDYPLSSTVVQLFPSEARDAARERAGEEGGEDHRG